MADGSNVQVETKTGMVTASPGQRALGMVSNVKVRLEGIPSRRRTWLLAGAAMIAAVVLGMYWYASRPDWKMLYTGLDGKDVQQVTQELGAAGIPFQMTPDGSSVQVPSEVMDKARMEVATKGMPQSGRLGFELFDKPNWVGSEFDERVNYQRALEGELEHTIGTLGVVRSARVHLALPQASLFAQEEKLAKASVVLRLKRANLPEGEADSIRNLVASAVENLSPEQVTLVDADGRVNLQAKSHTAAEADAEQMLEAKLVAMLEPLAGRENVRATVNVAYEDKSEESTDEVYDPAQSAALTVQKSERGTSGASRASGVPGTASNAPSGAPKGAVAGSEQAAAAGTPPLLQTPGLPVYPGGNNSASQMSKEESGTYAVSKHVTHTEEGANRVRRVTAAVVVNDRQMVEGSGKTEKVTWKPRSVEEMHRLEELAQAAVGFDAKRGDQVVMENVSFSSNAPEAKMAPLDKALEQAKGLLGQPGLLRTAMLGLLGLVLVFVILRPLTGQVIATLKEPIEMPAYAELGAGSAGATAAALGGGYPASVNSEEQAQQWLDAGGAANVPPVRISKQKPRDPVYHDVMDHIRREPGQSTRLLEAWIGSSEDGA